MPPTSRMTPNGHDGAMFTEEDVVAASLLSRLPSRSSSVDDAFDGLMLLQCETAQEKKDLRYVKKVKRRTNSPTNASPLKHSRDSRASKMEFRLPQIYRVEETNLCESC